jgi:hypothetical protein
VGAGVTVMMVEVPVPIVGAGIGGWVGKGLGTGLV